jgi:hypothetical protein
LRVVFVWGYERSVKRYLSAREELGEPDPFRMKYRSALTEVIRNLVLQTTADARKFVNVWTAEQIPENDRQRFINLVHAELKGLHEGNIARFRLRPAEFAAWQEKQGQGSRERA